ncbi:MAG: hypothetical protein ACE5H0_15275 [Bacteroidota bacterium]
MLVWDFCRFGVLGTMPEDGGRLLEEFGELLPRVNNSIHILEYSSTDVNTWKNEVERIMRGMG